MGRAGLTKNPKSGTTIRIDWKDKNPDQFALYLSCNTSLVDSYRRRFDGKLSFERNRAVIFPIDKPLPKAELMICIQMALLYHINR